MLPFSRSSFFQLLLAAALCFSASAVDVSVSIEPASTASALQIKLVPEFVKLVLNANRMTTVPCGGGQICATTGPLAVASFESKKAADAFVAGVNTVSATAVGMLMLDCDQEVVMTTGTDVYRIEPGSELCPATAFLPAMNVTITGFIKYKVGKAPDTPCLMMRQAIEAKKQGISFVKCKHSMRYHHPKASKLEFTLLMSVPNPDAAYISNALTYALDLIIPSGLEVPCGSTARYMFTVEEEQFTVEAPQTMFCGDGKK
eukprot:gene27378-4681_t